MLAVDGKRPIDPSDLEIEAVQNIDGQRPIAKSKFLSSDTLEIDGSRPIGSNNTIEEPILTDYVD